MDHRKTAESAYRHNPLWLQLATSIKTGEEQGISGLNPALHTKLTVGAPDDPYEREADQVAERVMRMPGEALSPGSPEGEGLPPASLLQAKPLTGLGGQSAGRSGPTRFSATGAAAGEAMVSPAVRDAVFSPGIGAPLASAVRSRLDPMFGRRLDDVLVHTDAPARIAARDLGARAFTHHNNIFLGIGQSPDDLSLMAHEATHVIQQTGNSGRIQRNFATTTEQSGPAEAEAALPAHPSRPPHEIVIMSGGPTSNRMDPEHDANPLNFATAARIRIQRLMESAFGDQRQMIPTDTITWVIMRPPYRFRAVEDGEEADAYINQLSTGSLARLQGDWDRLRASWLEQHPQDSGFIPSGAAVVQLHFVDSAADFVTFMNEGAAGGGRVAASFAAFTTTSKPVGRFEYFGHGAPGLLWFTMGWDHLASRDQTLSSDELAAIDPNVFVSEAQYRSWSCNTATPEGADATSFAQAWVERFGGRFVGAVGRTTYEFILDPSNPRGEVLLSREEPAHWQMISATGPVAETGPATFTPAPEESGREQTCQLEIVPLDQPASPGELVCTDEGAGQIDLIGCGGGGAETAAPAVPAAARGASCLCEKATVMRYDAETLGYIRGIRSMIKSAAKHKGVPAPAIAGAIADEYNTRRGFRVILDAAQDALLDLLPESFIDVDRFFDFKSKLLNTMENDVGNANINVRTALELVQRGELTVPGSPITDPQVSRIIDFLMTDRGTAQATAAVIGRAQRLFAAYLTGYPVDLHEGVLVTYFKQGESYYERAMQNVRANPEHEICPGEGGCRFMNNRSSLRDALFQV
ncbi:eCIS core domain-containing protein [Desulfobulbus propionicus]